MKGVNSGQSADDVTAAVIIVNFIGCVVDDKGCKSCNRDEFEAVDTANADYIWANTKGCTQCYQAWEPYLYESTTTPSTDCKTNGNCDIIRGCLHRHPFERRRNDGTDDNDLNEGEQCGWGAVLSPISARDSTLVCKPCTEVINGCALCSSHRECLQCMDPAANVITMKDAGGEELDVCTTSDLCYNPIATTEEEKEKQREKGKHWCQ